MHSEESHVTANRIYEQASMNADYAYHILGDALGDAMHDDCGVCQGAILEAVNSVHMIKSEASILAKLTSSRPVDDALRSSFIIPPENMATCTREIYENLMQKCTNTTSGREVFFTDLDSIDVDENNTGYRGIKLKLHCESVPIEVQFHTPNSKHINKEMHPFYKRGNFDECAKLAKRVFVPEALKDNTLIDELPRACD